MPKTEKAVNYSPENVATMESVYGSANTDAERKDAVSTLAKDIGKTVNSIRAKLSKMGIYIKPKATSKNGTVTVKKDALVTIIATLTGQDESLMGSLEKSTKFALEAIIKQFDAYETLIAELEAEQDVSDET